MRSAVLLALFFGSSLGVVAPTVTQQVVAIGPQRPRFIATWAPAGKVVDASKAAVLWRHLAVDLKEVPVDAALQAIAAQARLELSYDKSLLTSRRLVSLRAQEITVAAALTEVLLGSGLDVGVGQSGQLTLMRAMSYTSAERAIVAGAILGRVTDAKTQTALTGATVVVEGTRQSATTGSDGRYRIAGVPAGTYTVRARYIGYAPGTASVTVSANEEATADFSLEKSVQQLDEVVTTGTVTPTEVKALPTPITVVTGDEIQQKGYQRIDQIFRGDIPGAIAFDQGTNSWASSINIRGANSIFPTSVKTYIDGIEVADPFYVATIDPASIERIEVLRGPQGSTIYGSQALAGVVQIFTKKGDFATTHPQVEAKLSAGLIESPWVSGSTLEQDHAVTVTGGGQGFSYRVGGGYAHEGEWAPEYSTSGTSLNGGLRGTQGPVTVELAARYYNKSLGWALDPRLRDAGYTSFSKPLNQTNSLNQQTGALTFTFAATPHWRHKVTVGYDRSESEYYNNQPRYTTPADSLLTVYSRDATKSSVAYNTTYDVSLGRAVRSSLTAGADHYVYHVAAFSANGASSSTNTIAPVDEATRSQYRNTGYFAQAQVGFWDAMFVTGGVRAEDNQNFGKDFGLAWAPRVGVSYVRRVGDVTAKARVAYGKAIRPPSPGDADGVVTSFYKVLANPDLSPEQQRGIDGGVELYFGTHGSLEATYYNQTAVDLIDFVLVDVGPPVRTFQNQNVGRIRNTGWEFRAQLNAGRLSVAGTYSITTSLLQELESTYTGPLRPGDQLLNVPKHTAGATLSYSLPRTAVTLGMTHVGSWVNIDYLALYGYYYGGQPYRGSSRAYWITYPSFTKLNLSVSQMVTHRLGVFLQSNNLTNNHAFEGTNLVLNAGRSSFMGVRMKL